MKMDKKKILLIVIILLFITGLVLITTLSSPKNTKSVATKLCETVSNDLKTKDNLLIFFTTNYSSDESNDTLERFKKEYPKIHTISLTDADIKHNCMKDILSKNNVYDDLTKAMDTAVIAFEDGSNVGMIMGVDDFSILEDYLVDIKFMEKRVLKEDVNYNEFKEKEADKEYLILIVGTEEQRVELSKLMTKYFSDYNYDVVNLESDIGEKIRDDIQKNNKVSNEFPQIFYFKNGKLEKYGEAYDEVTFEKIQKDLKTSNITQ